jgi:hypothetical protein
MKKGNTWTLGGGGGEGGGKAVYRSPSLSRAMSLSPSPSPSLSLLRGRENALEPAKMRSGAFLSGTETSMGGGGGEENSIGADMCVTVKTQPPQQK